ncbi:cyclin-G1-like isoform X2 [Oscarella lobularis]|uniref:cyclin-G1-like isoform X2 n=1 Tax=Oscarella lobularis TaxID=121494 RepID=UPI0033132C61
MFGTWGVVAICVTQSLWPFREPDCVGMKGVSNSEACANDGGCPQMSEDKSSSCRQVLVVSSPFVAHIDVTSAPRFASANRNRARFDREVLSSKEIARLCDYQFSAPDIVRMERIVLNKLNFDANAITPLHFIQVFHMGCLKANFLKGTGRTQEEHLRAVVRRLQFCAQDYRFLTYRASTLALALFMTECKQLPEFDWLTVSLNLQTASQIPGRELSICFEEVQEFFLKRDIERLARHKAAHLRLGSSGEEDRNSKEKPRICHRRQISKSCRGEAELVIESDTEVFVV